MENSQSIIAVGTSTGGLAALKSLLQALPESFTMPILITMHTDEESILPDLLSTSCFARFGMQWTVKRYGPQRCWWHRLAHIS